jgi:hypothetical protein
MVFSCQLVVFTGILAQYLYAGKKSKGTLSRLVRTHLKNVFWPPAFIGGIGASFSSVAGFPV